MTREEAMMKVKIGDMKLVRQQLAAQIKKARKKGDADAERELTARSWKIAKLIEKAEEALKELQKEIA